MDARPGGFGPRRVSPAAGPEPDPMIDPRPGPSDDLADLGRGTGVDGQVRNGLGDHRHHAVPTPTGPSPQHSPVGDLEGIAAELVRLEGLPLAEQVDGYAAIHQRLTAALAVTGGQGDPGPDSPGPDHPGPDYPGAGTLAPQHRNR